MLYPGIVGVQGSMVIRLRPRRVMSTPPHPSAYEERLTEEFNAAIGRRKKSRGRVGSLKMATGISRAVPDRARGKAEDKYLTRAGKGGMGVCAVIGWSRRMRSLGAVIW